MSLYYLLNYFRNYLTFLFSLFKFAHSGIWILGGITPKKHFSSIDKTFSSLTRASEKSTLGIRINIEEINKSDSNDIYTINGNTNNNSHNSDNSREKINCSWILPLNQDKNNDEKQSNNLKTIKVIERFECLNSGSKIFSNEVLKAKKMKLKEESSEAETGPRSIAQVRRENKKSDNDNNNGNENNTMNNDDILQDVKIHENENDGNKKKLIQIFSSKKYKKFPESVYDLAKVDSDNDSITVIVYWVCRINGKIIRGIHSLGGASILPETPQIISLLTKPINTTDNAIISKLDDASDYLSLALKYPISAIISKNEKNKNIEIFLEIKSNSKKILIISAEIIDKKNRAITPEIGLNSSNIDRNPNFHSQRGLRWERKTNITDIVLFPYESKSVSFYAVVSMPGVFDLNRYVPYRTVPYSSVP